MKKIILAAALLSSISVFAADDATSSVHCKTKSSERVLEIAKKDSGCVLKYTKDGNTTEIASQKNGNEKCESVQAKVKDTLAKAGYTCE